MSASQVSLVTGLRFRTHETFSCCCSAHLRMSSRDDACLVWCGLSPWPQASVFLHDTSLRAIFFFFFLSCFIGMSQIVGITHILDMQNFTCYWCLSVFFNCNFLVSVSNCVTCTPGNLGFERVGEQH